jgi:hypothetical protein
MSGLKENGMSNGEVLAVVNNIHTQNPEPYIFSPSFPATTMVLLHTFGIQGLS